MQLDLSFIKNDTVIKFEKAIKNVKVKFQDTLAIALNAAIKEIDPIKLQEVDSTLNDLLNDELKKYNLLFIQCMNKASKIVENGLSD